MKKFFLVLFILAACKEENAIPPGTIDETKMVNILIRLHIAEARVTTKNLTPDSSFKYYHYLQGKIYQEFKVDSGTFNRSFRYYASQSKQMDKIYAAVVDSLSLRESRKMMR